MKTILVSGASGIVGYGSLKSLRQSRQNYTLIGTTIYNDSVAPAFCDVFELAPPTTDEKYIDWLCTIIKKHHVDMIIPGIEIDMFAWNDARDKIIEAGALPLLNYHELINLCVDKWKFYEKLKAAESEYAIESRLEGTFQQFKKDFGLPFLLKPRRGYASKGIAKVEDEKTFDSHKDELGKTLMAQPIVGTKDAEYTVSAFFDSNNKLLCHMGLRRTLSAEGFTEKAQVDEPADVDVAIKTLAKIFKPVGPTNFQFRVHNGRLMLLEINPRVSSATSIRTAFGYNESEMSVEYFLNHKVPKQPQVKSGYAVRYTEDYIVYDSDPV